MVITLYPVLIDSNCSFASQYWDPGVPFPLLPGHSYLFHSRETVWSLGMPQSLFVERPPLPILFRTMGWVIKWSAVQRAFGNWCGDRGLGPQGQQMQNVGILRLIPFCTRGEGMIQSRWGQANSSSSHYTPQLDSHMCANLCYLPESSKCQHVFYVTRHDKETELLPWAASYLWVQWDGNCKIKCG